MFFYGNTCSFTEQQTAFCQKVPPQEQCHVRVPWSNITFMYENCVGATYLIRARTWMENTHSVPLQNLAVARSLWRSIDGTFVMRENTMFFFENTRYCLFLQGSDEGTLKMSLGHFAFIIVPVPCGTRMENIYVLVLAHHVLTSEHPGCASEQVSFPCSCRRTAVLPRERVQEQNHFF